jgi:hypothetical protein
MEICLGFIPIRIKEPGNTAHLLLPPVLPPLAPHIKTVNVVIKVLDEETFPAQSDLVNNMLIQLNQKNLLNKYIGQMVEVRIRNYEERSRKTRPSSKGWRFSLQMLVNLCTSLTKRESVDITASSSPLVSSYRLFR